MQRLRQSGLTLSCDDVDLVADLAYSAATGMSLVEVIEEWHGPVFRNDP